MNEIKFLDLSRQYQIIKGDLEPAILKQMESGGYIGGTPVQEFEVKFANYIGVKHAISVNSGTDALVISLRAAGIKQGDEVLTTAFSFFATAEAIAMLGAIPVFIDVDEFTYNMNPLKLEEKITDKTKAILPVHLFGQPAEMDEIIRVANQHNLLVIEDSCQAVGAQYKGKMTGALSKAGCFSFFPTKNLGAFGDGGMITTDDDELAVICRALKEHGMAQNGAKARFLLEGIEDEIDEGTTNCELYNPYKYFNYLVAYNSRLDALQAVVLNVKLKYLDDFNNRRREIARFYKENLKGIREICLPKEENDTTHVWHQFAFRCKEKKQLGKFLAEKGVGSAAFYPVPLNKQKAFLYLGYKEDECPSAQMLSQETVCLPIFPELQDHELKYIVQCIREYYKH